MHSEYWKLLTIWTAWILKKQLMMDWINMIIGKLSQSAIYPKKMQRICEPLGYTKSIIQKSLNCLGGYFIGDLEQELEIFICNEFFVLRLFWRRIIHAICFTSTETEEKWLALSCSWLVDDSSKISDYVERHEDDIIWQKE